jgi:selenocysteine lyase/cysteine desulfurase
MRAGPVPIETTRWSSIRAAFDLSSDRLHLSCNMLSSHPTPVREAIERHRHGLDANPTGYLARHGAELDDLVRRAAASHVGAEPDQVALTESTMMGLALLGHGIRVRPDQEIVMSQEEFGSFRQLLALRARRSCSQLRDVVLYDDPANVDQDALASGTMAAINDRTRLLALTWVHSSTGVKMPVEVITQRIAEHNLGRSAEDSVIVVLDAVHGFGIENVSLSQLGVDFLVSGTHKWLFGPRGTGIVCARPGAWEQVDLLLPPFGSAETPGQQFTRGGFQAFEHRWALSEAFAFHGDCRAAAIESHTHALARRAKEGLAAIGGVTVLTPAAHHLSSGFVCFNIAGLEAGEAVRKLRAHGCVATEAPYRRRCIRLAPGLVNSIEEVDAGIDVVARVAAGS